jgi:hypothetical protein
MRRLGGQRLCAYCLQWARNPYKTGGLFFCDRIHSSIFFNKQKEAMKQAMEKSKEKDLKGVEKDLKGSDQKP